ncbi:MAG: DUF962 domain-containing protein [Proteobacteria bacterium]|nr:DUF962 domain-containing protein [Pseudomonadota bacterium]
MPDEKLRTYAEFWPIYLKLHSKRATKTLHVIGLILGVLAFILGFVLARWELFVLGPALGYGFAWCSHFFVEKNRPAAWTYPWWSFISDFRMAFLYLTKKL